jgi:hypothetical protein
MDGDPEKLHRRADHFRQLAILVMDDRAHDAALRLAREYDELAETIAHGGGAGRPGKQSSSNRHAREVA